MVKSNSQLSLNLSQLQNLIKRDPLSYKDEFLKQEHHFLSLLEIFSMNPVEFNKGLAEIIIFIAQVSHCYTDVLTSFAERLISILRTSNAVLNADMRMVFCKALILLRNKGLLKPMDLFELFYFLIRCNDKKLRKFLQDYIIKDVKNMNKHKNEKFNKRLQNFMFKMLKENNAKAAKMSTDIMIELFKKNIWNDSKTTNVLSVACFSKITKVMVAAIKFFATNPSHQKDVDSESDLSSDDNTPNMKDVLIANKFKKKTRKRERTFKKIQKIVKKKKNRNDNEIYNAIYMVHDPQDFAEKLLKQLEKRNERFEVKLLTLDVISKLIGFHQLILLNFYPYIQRFLQPHQKEVTKLLQFIAQASHELIPPDVMEPILKTLANNFITERNSSDVIAIGLNSIREMCIRAPLIMTEDLLWDLAQYKYYKERSVSMAAQSLIHVYRNSMPKLLPRKHRGRPTEASIELKVRQFGEIDTKTFIPGAEIILQDKNEINEINNSTTEYEWINVEHSSESSSDTEDEILEVIKDKVSLSQKDPRKHCEKMFEKYAVMSKTELAIQRKHLATEVSLTKILTDEDFRKIDAAQIRKEITSAKSRKRLAEPEINCKEKLVNLSDIENIFKRRRHDKEARLRSVMQGRAGRDKFGYQDRRQNPLCSRTNRERQKKKSFMMIKHKVKAKVKRSFKDKQIRTKTFSSTKKEKNIITKARNRKGDI